MSDKQDFSDLKIAAMAICVPVIAIVVIAAISAMLFGCETTGPDYDPETTCSVDSARAEIICRDKP
ncbi:MAG TPA: hypothetical protein PKO15_12685 [Fibrobacteria bacterium]|nr:hypothetical protein [Fibrobacteria bacterium]